MPLPRRTLIRTAEVLGAGLFTGRPAALRVHPAAAGTGVAFRRSDLRESEPIPVHVSSLTVHGAGMPARNTSLGPGTDGVMTVEHVLSALAGLGITDALIEVDGPEVPIGDGSAVMFAQALVRSGVVEHGEPVEPLTIATEIRVEVGAASIIARPRQAPGWRFIFELDYGSQGAIPRQSATFETSGRGDDADRYAREIAPARTFCLEAEARAMRAKGLFSALTPRDMLVFGNDGPIDNQLRFENEPARHKLLDLIGDLAVAGGPAQIEVVGVRAGHALNHEMARRLAAQWGQ